MTTNNRWTQSIAGHPMPCDANPNHIILTGCVVWLRDPSGLVARQLHVCEECYRLPGLDQKVSR